MTPADLFWYLVAIIGGIGAGIGVFIILLRLCIWIGGIFD